MADDQDMSIGTPLKVIGKPPTVVLSAALEARVAALLRGGLTSARPSARERRRDAGLLVAGPASA